MGKRVLITSGVLHPCPLHISWYFSYMHFSMNFQGNKSPLMTIFDLFGGDPACYPGQQLSGVRGRNCCCSDLLSVSNVWQGWNNPTYDPSHI